MNRFRWLSSGHAGVGKPQTLQICSALSRHLALFPKKPLHPGMLLRLPMPRPRILGTICVRYKLPYRPSKGGNRESTNRRRIRRAKIPSLSPRRQSFSAVCGAGRVSGGLCQPRVSGSPGVVATVRRSSRDSRCGPRLRAGIEKATGSRAAHRGERRVDRLHSARNFNAVGHEQCWAFLAHYRPCRYRLLKARLISSYPQPTS